MKKLTCLLLAVFLVASVFSGCVTYKVIDQPVQKIPEKETGDGGEKPTQTQPTNMLTEEEAIQIALEHAQLSRENVTRLHTEYEIDDGIAQWDVSFQYERLEYDYEIHGETGKILSYDVDND